jgi:hypothetical protein
MKDIVQAEPKRTLTTAQQQELDELSPSDRELYDMFLSQSCSHYQAMKNIYAAWC